MSIKRFVLMAAVGVVPIAIMFLLPLGTWADIDALPMHPLIVHGVIVLLPVTAIWLLASVWRPAILQRTYHVLWAMSVLSVLGVLAAKSSGDSLAAAVGLPEEHADAGNRMIPVAIAMGVLVLTSVFFTMVRPQNLIAGGSRVLGAIAGLVVLPLTYLAGHSGADSVWKEEYEEAQQPISAEWIELTMADVERRNTVDQCWTVVNGDVYDMTSFIARHPAGRGDIEDMCGTDASEDFLGEHQGQGEPEKWLATLKIGVLSGGESAP